MGYEKTNLGDVQMSKVKFDANQEYEYVQNYKVIQQAFSLHNVQKNIPGTIFITKVERLIKCKFQENIEFCQWVKKYHGTLDFNQISITQGHHMKQ